MLDIGAMELFVVAVLALVVVGPKELPKLLRTVGGFMRKARELAAEFRSGVEDLAAEVEREVDPFKDLREEEGLRPGMSPGEITDHIMARREAEMVDEAAKPDDNTPKPAKNPEKSEPKPPKSESKSPKSEPNTAKSEVSPEISPDVSGGQQDMFGPTENALQNDTNKKSEQPKVEKNINTEKNKEGSK